MNMLEAASAYYETTHAILAAEANLRTAEASLQHLRARKKTIEESLAKAVGPNVTVRAFSVSRDEVLIVKHGAPTQLLAVEKTT
jgi:Tfp pilus assembly protein PilX